MPGRSYNISVWVKADAGTTAQMQLWLHNATGTTSHFFSTAFTPGTGWQKVSLTYVADDSTAVRIHLHYLAGSGTIYYDDARIEQVNSGISTTRLFTGFERDTESALDHTWFRQYSSAQARWLSPDPLGGSIFNPQSMNRYVYVLNDPVNLFDPLGLHGCPAGTQHIQITEEDGTEVHDCVAPIHWTGGNGLDATGGPRIGGHTGLLAGGGRFILPRPRTTDERHGGKFTRPRLRGVLEAIANPINILTCGLTEPLRTLARQNQGAVGVGPSASAGLGVLFGGVGGEFGVSLVTDGTNLGFSVSIGAIIPGIPGTVGAGAQGGIQFSRSTTLRLSSGIEEYVQTSVQVGPVQGSVSRSLPSGGGPSDQTIAARVGPGAFGLVSPEATHGFTGTLITNVCGPR